MARDGVISDRLRSMFGPDLSGWPVSKRTVAPADAVPDAVIEFPVRGWLDEEWAGE